jgi:hypothetical protein
LIEQATSPTDGEQQTAARQKLGEVIYDLVFQALRMQQAFHRLDYFR